MSETTPPQLRVNVRVVPIGLIHPNPWNYNEQADWIFERERESIRVNGFLDPVTVRTHPTIPGHYEVIDGEHRYKAAKLEGLTELPINDLGALSDERAKALCIVLNGTKGDPNRVKLGELLRDLEGMMGRDRLLAEMPYREADIDGMVRALDFSFDEFAAPLDAPTPAPAQERVSAPAAPEGDAGAPTYVPTSRAPEAGPQERPVETRGAAPKDARPMLGDGLMYRVIVDCTGETHQAELLERFATEGLKCRPLIS